DFALDENRLIAVGSTARRQEMKLMAITAGAVAGASIARIDPQRYAVGSPRPAGVALGQLVLAAHLDLKAKAQVAPSNSDIREIAALVHGCEVVHPAGFRQIEQTIVLLAGHVLHVDAGISNAKQEAIGNE